MVRDTKKPASLMIRENINDLIAFVAVAEERSFTRAAARLNLSQSALSHTIKSLEQRLGLRLLTRTTRSVAPTLEGEDLLATLTPCIERIESRLQALNDSRDEPTGTVRIIAPEYAIASILWPRFSPVLKKFPSMNIELVADNENTDLVQARCDAGVRYGDQVGEGMIAVRIGPDERMICVGTPAYFKDRGQPDNPGTLTEHACINLRQSNHGAPQAWAFEDENGKDVRVKVSGQVTFNTINAVLRAACDGHGLARVPERLARPHLEAGHLQTCLDDFCPTFPGFHLYYPSRQRASSAFEVVLEALREKR
ncbi:LysR family transcriptional regulator [Mameliella sp.]|uniref:LysR family transcriptional regulator n=1 Tax=Mameliella sp. TaxID=1924940 RepID=UPI003B513F0A